MLIKTSKKNLVVIRNLGSDYIDEAYFILKDDLPDGADGDIVREANRVIADYQRGRKRRRPSLSLVSFLLGAFAAGALALVLLWIF